ncbi:MAG: hypothetical protein GY764_04195 [Halieaceae bacterium]|nr:hypothetical protein [Halieaceae bacterium]
MDTTQLAQMVTWLDEQHRRDRAEITRLQQRLESQTNELQEQARRMQELEARLVSTQTQLGKFTQIEQSIDNLKAEVVHMYNTQAEEVTKGQRELERARMTDRETFTRSVTEVRKELPRFRVIEEELAVRKAEDQRLSEIVINLRQEVSEVAKNIDEKTRGIPFLSEQRTHDNKRIAQLQQENVELFKRVEEFGSRQQMLVQKNQKLETQVIALPPLVDNMKRGQEQFIESLKLADADRQRQMRDWHQAFELQEQIIEEQRERIQAYAKTNEETKRNMTMIEQFQMRLQRDQGQVAELQRLAEERQRKELASFLSDNEKLWKKQLLEWNFRWEQQDKVNARIREHFPKIDEQLAYYEEYLHFFWRHVETQGGAQLKAAQAWLNDIQKLAAQREKILNAHEEASLGLTQQL